MLQFFEVWRRAEGRMKIAQAETIHLNIREEEEQNKGGERSDETGI